jgi:amidase
MEITADEKNRDYHSKVGHPEQSEFTVVKTEFYNAIKEYLAGLTTNPNNIKSLEDIVEWNAKHAETEGGKPNTHPAWPSGQDNFELSLASKGVMDETYHKALEFIRKKSREEGIDAALQPSQGVHLDGLLVPLQAENGAASQVAAKAGLYNSRQFTWLR